MGYAGGHGLDPGSSEPRGGFLRQQRGRHIDVFGGDPQHGIAHHAAHPAAIALRIGIKRGDQRGEIGAVGPFGGAQIFSHAMQSASTGSR